MQYNVDTPFETAKKFVNDGFCLDKTKDIDKCNLYTRTNILRASNIIKEGFNKLFNTEISKLELQIKMLKIQKKEKNLQISQYEKQLCIHYGHKIGKLTIPAPIKEKCWNTYIGIFIGESHCVCCKNNKISKSNFQAGHVTSEVNGGEITIENLRPICGQCNSSMGIKNMDIFMKENGLN